MNVEKLHAHLILGSQEEVTRHAERYIKERLCSSGGCNRCVVCSGVEQRQHYSLLWIAPEKNYTRELLEPVFHRLTFACNPEHPFFIVLEAADFLTPAVGNSLLKSLEEPPAGYIFLLLARAQEFVMPTIASRCVVYNCNQQPTGAMFDQFTSLFFKPTAASYTRFNKELDEIAKYDRFARSIIDEIYSSWANELITALQNNNEQQAAQARRACDILEENMQRPPMPGSVKLFFRTLFMQLKQV